MLIGPRLAFGKTDNQVLCGNGNFIELRELGNFNVRGKVEVFDTTIICGICRLGNKGYLCYGDRKLATLDCNFQVLSEMNMHSWITAAKCLSDGTIVVLTASSLLYQINSTSFVIEDRMQLESFGVLISGFIHGNSWEDLTVFVGVFDFIKMFRPSTSPKAEKTFLGHTGMIFAFAQLDNILYSISDDRSLRAWNIETSEAIASAFGHNSRPFAIEVSNEIGILTAGADQTVCIWQLNNNQLELQKQIVLDGGPIRSLCLVDSKLLIGTDTGSLFSAQLDTKVPALEFSLAIEQKNINAFLRYSNQTFVVIAESRELWIHSNDQQQLLLNDAKFKTNTLLKIHQTSFFSVCTIDNAVCVFDVIQRRQLSFLQLDYLCSSTIWIHNYLLVSSGAEQKCFIYELLDSVLTYRGSFIFSGRDTLASCGCLYEDKICVGTSRGSLLMLSREDLKIIKVYPRVHKKSLVSDLKLIKQKLYSIGKDGRFNIWKIDENLDLKAHSTFATVDWPARLLTDVDGNLKFIGGFSGDQFLLINAENFLIDFQVYCGGGHRIFEYSLSERKLDFINKSRMYTIMNNGPNAKKLEGSWHQSEFTSLAVYPLDRNEDKFLVCTGGNDTQIAISEYSTISDEIVLRFKSNRHVGSIHDMALCGEFLITVGGFAEFYLWRLLVTDQEICYLDKQKLDLETRIVSVDARLVDNLLLIAVAESYGSIKLFEYELNGRLKRTRSVELDGVLSFTRVCFANDSLFTSVTTSGHLVCYEFDTNDKFVEQNKQFVERNSLTALCTSANIVVVGSVSGQISATVLGNTCAFSTQLAHGSTVTDMQLNVEDELAEIFSISLDRCLVVSRFDSSSNKLSILRTIAHTIYDPSRIRILTRKPERKRKYLITGYGMQTIST